MTPFVTMLSLSIMDANYHVVNLLYPVMIMIMVIIFNGSIYALQCPCYEFQDKKFHQNMPRPGAYCKFDIFYNDLPYGIREDRIIALLSQVKTLPFYLNRLHLKQWMTVGS